MTVSGFFDPTIDYAAAERYEITYIHCGNSILFDAISEAFAAWASRMNVAYSRIAADDADGFLATIRSCAAGGTDGFILDPFGSDYATVADVMNTLGLPWMSGISVPADPVTGTLLHPSVGFHQYKFGYDMFTWCINEAEASWPDAAAGNTGAIFLGFDMMGDLIQRHTGAKAAWGTSAFCGADGGNFFYGDFFDIGGLDAAAAQTYTAAIMAGHPEITYWVACGFYDAYTLGIVNAAEAAGKADTTVCSSVGGMSLFAQWDSGTATCWKSGVFFDVRLYAEPMFCALYAQITGQVTASDLWAQWRSNGEAYAALKLPTVIVTQENYRDILEYVDTYSGIDWYPY